LAREMPDRLDEVVMTGSMLAQMNTAKVEKIEIRIGGKTLFAPSVDVCGRTVIVTGGWLRMAAVNDEELVEEQIVENPIEFIQQLKKTRLPADIFTFAQKLPEITPKYHYDFEWDNSAVIPITCFSDWWEKRLPQETRKNVRRAAKRGVVVRPVQFSDELVKGIHEIYNESRVRQGVPFRHFGKDFETVKNEMSTYLDRSEFHGAYVDEELIGFTKMVYVDRIGSMIHIISKMEHQDKRPMNALVANAVKVCESKSLQFLVYCKYVYFGNTDSSLTEFKRRNGFEQIRFPRYYLPLNAKGALAIKSGLHRGLQNLVPVPMRKILRDLRSRYYRIRSGSSEVLRDTVGLTE
jgi:hypothetical protein